MTSHTIRELLEADAGTLYPLIEQLNPGMERTTFDSIFTNMRGVNIRFVGVFDANGRLCAACSYWIGARFYCGRMMHVDSFVVDAHLRGGGVGGALVAWLEAHALAQGCSRIILDAYVHNAASHRFYFKHGFTIVGFHFNKMLHPA
jgi:GNAT superfamily N-acetyltransferase